MYDEVVGSVIKIIHRLDLTAKTSLEQEVITKALILAVLCMCVLCLEAELHEEYGKADCVCVCVC